jgi:hypothetical protein
VSGGAVTAAGRLYTSAQVAAMTQLQVATIRTAIRAGRFRAYLPAGRRDGYRISASAIRVWLDASATVPGREPVAI